MVIFVYSESTVSVIFIVSFILSLYVKKLKYSSARPKVPQWSNKPVVTQSHHSLTFFLQTWKKIET